MHCLPESVKAYYENAHIEQRCLDQDDIDTWPYCSWCSIPEFGPLDLEGKPVADAIGEALRDVAPSRADFDYLDPHMVSEYYDGPEGTVSTDPHYDGWGAPWDEAPFLKISDPRHLCMFPFGVVFTQEADIKRWRLVLGDCLARTCLYIRDRYIVGHEEPRIPSHMLRFLCSLNAAVRRADAMLVDAETAKWNLLTPDRSCSPFGFGALRYAV